MGLRDQDGVWSLVFFFDNFFDIKIVVILGYFTDLPILKPEVNRFLNRLLSLLIKNLNFRPINLPLLKLPLRPIDLLPISQPPVRKLRKMPIVVPRASNAWTAKDFFLS